MENILNKVFERHPIVHCITNYVTVNDVANVIIASGGSPIMSDDITEVEEIVNISDGLVINIGTLNKRTIESMILAGNVANKKGIPVIFDPVGAGASSFRNETVKRLLDEIEFSIIKGNSSEIKFMTGVSGKSRGVDVSFDDVISSDNIEGFISIAKKLSELTNATVVMSGEIDIVAEKNKLALIKNGHSMMAKITGSGCMLAGILGVYAAASGNDVKSVSTALSAFGLSGELAYKKTLSNDEGNSSFRNHLIDYMSKMNFNILNEGSKVEYR